MFQAIQSSLNQNEDACRAFELHNRETLNFGFLWNDIINFTCTLPVVNNQRGESCISLAVGFIQSFLESFTNENVKIVGLIRAHQHRSWPNKFVTFQTIQY